MILTAAAVAIVSISLFYTNLLVNKLSEEEQRKARLWAESIEEKAEFIRYTNNLFNKIEDEERQNVELWANASKRLADPKNDGNLSFVFEVVKNNETVPVILADNYFEPIRNRNRNVDSTLRMGLLSVNRDSIQLFSKVNGNEITQMVPYTPNTRDSVEAINKRILRRELAEMRALYPPLEIRIAGNKRQYLFYKNSYIFTELKNARDDLINSFTDDIIKNSANVPVIYTNSETGEIIAYGNFEAEANSSALYKKLEEMKESNEPIQVDLGPDNARYVYYEESFLLTQLRYYPYVQFFIIGIFLLIAYFMFSTARKSEQNQVWVGMAKETAHQLGTPLSSLMAWLEYLKLKEVDPNTLKEIEKDINRLETITDRFSKIGSSPDLEPVQVHHIVHQSVEYLRKRISDKVELQLSGSKDITALINVPLFEWVIENLTKNAVDAMAGKGQIQFEISKNGDKVYLDVTDTGKGIPKSKFRSIFQPGYTSKKRGWGLGLTLVKRIVENYHNGQIFVRKPESGKGASFRIILQSADFV